MRLNHSLTITGVRIVVTIVLHFPTSMILIKHHNSSLLSSPRQQVLVLLSSVVHPLLSQPDIITNMMFVSAFFTEPIRRNRYIAQRGHFASFTNNQVSSFLAPSSLSHISSYIPTTSTAPNVSCVRGTSSNDNEKKYTYNQQTSQREQQRGYMTQIEDFKGVTKSYTSSSQYVTHFVTPDSETGTFTIEKAIESVLPRPIPNVRKRKNGEQIDMSLWTKQLTDHEKNNPLLQSIEAKFRHDPAQLGDLLFSINHKGGGFDTDTDDNADGGKETKKMEEADQLSAAELISLGSVWFLPNDAPTDPSLGTKPIRVELKDLHKILKSGDYLRVHHSPKRYPSIHCYDWGGKYCSTSTGDNGSDENKLHDLPGVIVKEDKEIGYIIVNKPCGVPVHPTVDNVLENVAGAVGRSLLRKHSDSILKQFNEEREMSSVRSEDGAPFGKKRTNTTYRKKEGTKSLVYVATPQRLDQNTSGLFVVATKKSFAAHFAKLLRKKTDKLLNTKPNSTLYDHINSNNRIQKKYRCLVCVNTNPGAENKGSLPVSMWDEVQRLQVLAQNATTVRHYLEPALKVPRIFASTQDANSTWLECLLRVCNVGNPFPVLGSVSSVDLSKRIWGDIRLKPNHCVAIVEVEIELLTGRTHQVRGQLAAMGFPLCGDLIYGGSQLSPSPQTTSGQGYRDSDSLCLQCCELSFHDPENQQNNFRLENAWWSKWLEEYSTESASKNTLDEATTSASDSSAEVKAISYSDENILNNESCIIEHNKTTMMPSKIELSPGKNKYVVIKASKPGNFESDWFVRSASPTECGGLYHADVARPLVEQLTKTLGYRVSVMGGGRIDYCNNHAHVYGFSYGFGKGDHEFVSLLIEKYMADDLLSLRNPDAEAYCQVLDNGKHGCKIILPKYLHEKVLPKRFQKYLNVPEEESTDQGLSDKSTDEE